MNQDLGYPWFFAFLFTQAVEVPIYVYGGRARWDEGFCASALTHPIVWFVIPQLFDRVYLAVCAPHRALWITEGHRYWLMVVIAETFAILAEGLYMRWLDKPNPYRWALIANLASVTLGLTSRSIFGVP